MNLKKQWGYKILQTISISIIFFYRLSLIDKGFLEDSDEYSFLFLIIHFDQLYAFDIQTWVQTMFHTSSTIPETLIRLVQLALLTPFASYLGLSLTSTQTLSLIGFFNIVVSIVNLLLFYKILIRLKFSSFFSISGIVLLGSMLNFNLFIRHILPYETGLMFQLIALILLIKDKLTKRTLLISGVFSALGFTNYFGYFMFVFILIGLIFWNDNQSIVQDRLKRIAVFLYPFILITLIIELMSQLAGDSYILHIILFSETVIQGSPNEGLIYILKYLYQVEKIMGVFLFIAFVLGTILIFSSKEQNVIFKLLVLSIVAYIIYGSYVFFTGNMVFYGRVLHMYYPFVVIGAGQTHLIFSHKKMLITI